MLAYAYLLALTLSASIADARGAALRLVKAALAGGTCGGRTQGPHPGTAAATPCGRADCDALTAATDSSLLPHRSLPVGE